MSAKHTLGPWIAGNDDDSDFFLVGPDDGDGIVSRPVVKLHDEAIANLIAAAPELLDVVRKFVSAGTVSVSTLDFSLRCDEFINEARAAIAKATGE